jgi:hypothetical protein
MHFYYKIQINVFPLTNCELPCGIIHAYFKATAQRKIQNSIFKNFKITVFMDLNRTEILIYTQL